MPCCEAGDAFDLVKGHKAHDVGVAIGKGPVGGKGDHIDVCALGDGFCAANCRGKDRAEEKLSTGIDCRPGCGLRTCGSAFCIARDEFKVGVSDFKQSHLCGLEH